MTVLRDRYELLTRIGGGQGDLFLADDRLHGRRVALKIRRFSNDAERTRILREGATLLQLEPHPSVVVAREDFIDGDRYCLVMDWVEGVTLASLIEHEGAPGLDAGRAVDLVEGAAQALAHLHAQDPPVVHGDVKPSNLIVTRGGRVVLVDFGLSSSGDDGSPVHGTIGYLAPERAAGGAASPAGDIFGLAATAAALLTGTSPTLGERPRIARSSRTKRAEMTAALGRGLHLSPSARTASADAFASSMRAALTDVGSRAHADVRTRNRSVFAQRGRRGVALTAALLLVGVAVPVALTRPQREPVRAPGSVATSPVAAAPSASTPTFEGSEPAARTKDDAQRSAPADFDAVIPLSLRTGVLRYARHRVESNGQGDERTTTEPLTMRVSVVTGTEDPSYKIVIEQEEGVFDGFEVTLGTRGLALTHESVSRRYVQQEDPLGAVRVQPTAAQYEIAFAPPLTVVPSGPPAARAWNTIGTEGDTRSPFTATYLGEHEILVSGNTYDTVAVRWSGTSSTGRITRTIWFSRELSAVMRWTESLTLDCCGYYSSETTATLARML